MAALTHRLTPIIADRIVVASVFACGHKLQILKSVVVFNMVLMVNHLIAGKWSVKMFRHHKAMLKDVAIAVRVRMVREQNQHIAILFEELAALVVRVFVAVFSVDMTLQAWGRAPGKTSQRPVSNFNYFGGFSASTFTDTGGNLIGVGRVSRRWFARFNGESCMVSAQEAGVSNGIGLAVFPSRWNGSAAATFTQFHRYILAQR